MPARRLGVSSGKHLPSISTPPRRLGPKGITARGLRTSAPGVSPGKRLSSPTPVALAAPPLCRTLRGVPGGHAYGVPPGKHLTRLAFPRQLQAIDRVGPASSPVREPSVQKSEGEGRPRPIGSLFPRGNTSFERPRCRTWPTRLEPRLRPRPVQRTCFVEARREDLRLAGDRARSS